MQQEGRAPDDQAPDDQTLDNQAVKLPGDGRGRALDQGRALQDMLGQPLHHHPGVRQEHRIGKERGPALDRRQARLHAGQGFRRDQLHPDPLRPAKSDVRLGGPKPRPGFIKIEAAPPLHQPDGIDPLGQPPPGRAGIRQQSHQRRRIARGGGGQGLAGKTHKPGHKAWQRRAADRQRRGLVEQQRRQIFQHRGRADRHDCIIGNRPRIAKAGTRSRRVRIDQHHVAPVRDQRLGDGKADDTGTKNRHFAVDILTHQDLWLNNAALRPCQASSLAACQR